jgi:hypothetical protein
MQSSSGDSDSNELERSAAAPATLAALATPGGTARWVCRTRKIILRPWGNLQPADADLQASILCRVARHVIRLAVPSGNSRYLLTGWLELSAMAPCISARKETSHSMKLHSSFAFNNRSYEEGQDVPWYMVYPFFLVHMAAFGASGFFMAYGAKHVDVAFLYMHGGLAITVYTIFYLSIFGRDEVKWMFINAALGVFGIYSQIGWLVSLFGRRIGDYPPYVNAIPFLYFVLYTFLIRHAFLDLLGARESEDRKQVVDYVYIAVSLGVSIFFWFLQHR